ncbi:MAG: DNA/RNA nuclease SfsA [Desulfurivibrionaceae bacterium]
MKFDRLYLFRLVERYQRFLVDVKGEDGRILTAHCPNTGSMRGCLEPGSPVLLSWSGNRKRKYPYTLEMIYTRGTWVGVNTSRTNHLVREALENGIIKEFSGIELIKQEVKVSEGSRLDFFIICHVGQVYMEVKNCTLVEDGIAMFPDAVTKRGSKHLQDLIRLKGEGYETAVFFCVQRMDGRLFAPAVHIDPGYGQKLNEAAEAGVKILAYQACTGKDEIRITGVLPVRQ